jgi:hypothetical protein
MFLFAARCHVHRLLHTLHLVPKKKAPSSQCCARPPSLVNDASDTALQLTRRSTTEDASHLPTSCNSVSRIPWARCPRADSVVCIDDNNCWALVGLGGPPELAFAALIDLRM